MTEQELRQQRCCFTGHRPERLGMPEIEVISGLKKEIRQAIADGFQTFISGMARGGRSLGGGDRAGTPGRRSCNPPHLRQSLPRV